MARLLWGMVVAVVMGGLSAPAQAVTSYSAMTLHLSNLAATCDKIKLDSIGMSSSGNRTIWAVTVADPKSDPSQTTRLLILCRQHGDEPASTEAALGFLDRIAAGTAAGASDALKFTTLYIIPMVNPDGADALTRVNGRGVDLNRDWGRFNAPETRAVRSAIRTIRPTFVFDLHSWDTTDPFRANCLEAPRFDSAVASAARSVQARAVNEIGDGTGQPMASTSFSRFAESTLCHRYMVDNLGIPSLLFETAAGPNEGPDFTRRVDLARNLILWALRDNENNDAAWAQIVQATGKQMAVPESGLGARRPVTESAPAVQPTPIMKRIVRIPRAIWLILAVYLVAAVLIQLCRPKMNDPGYLRAEAGPTVKKYGVIVHGVYISGGPLPKPKLTMPQRKRVADIDADMVLPVRVKAVRPFLPEPAMKVSLPVWTNEDLDALWSELDVEPVASSESMTFHVK